MFTTKKTIVKLRKTRLHAEQRREPLRRDLLQQARAVARWALMGRRCQELAYWFPRRYTGRTYSAVA